MALSDAGAFGGVGGHVDLTKDYIVVLQHPVTTEHGKSRAHIEETLHAVAECGIPAVWFWPNVDAGSDGTSRGIRAFREHHDLPHVHFIKNLPPEDFVRLVHNSRGIVGNSSMAIREASWLGAPAVNIGNRQADRDRGRNVVDVPYDRQAILAAIRSQAAKGRLQSDPVYGNGDAGVQIADVLAKAPLRIEKRLTY